MPASPLWDEYVEPDRSSDAAAVAAHVFGAGPDPEEEFRRTDPYGNEIDRPNATWLTLTLDPGTLFRPLWDFSGDPIRGELRYRQRDYYLLAETPQQADDRAWSDRTSLDDCRGEILIGDHRGASSIGGTASNRVPTAPSEGQRLQRNRLGEIKPSIEALRQHAPDSQGLADGVGTTTAPTEAPPGQHLWRVIKPDGTEATVAAKTKVLARKAAKELLKWSEWPASARIGRCEG